MHPLSRQNCHPRVGQTFAANNVEYELMGRIGNGAASIVQKAKVKSSGKIVAVKFLAPDPKYIDPQAFDEVSQRFAREGVRGSGLAHENLVKIETYESNEAGACFHKRGVANPFIVMEYVKGKTLESLIKTMSSLTTDKVFFNKQTVRIATQVARALEYLHGLKIIHRDVKPANIFLSTTALGKLPSVVKLGDFGVTKWGDFLAAYLTGSLTVTHQQGLGTLKYMSPEQSVKPKYVTVRSDMFSFGVTLYELFSGKILPSPHHIFEIMMVRYSRSTITGKLYSLGIHSQMGVDDELFELILNMFMSGPKGRPSSTNARGKLEYMYERYFEEEDA